MKSLELKVPPLVVAACTAILMWLAAATMSVPQLPIAVRLSVGVMFALWGIGLTISGVRSFQRAQTTVNPLRPDTSSVLVTQGIYRFTRNPMYLGMLLALFGWGGRFLPVGRLSLFFHIYPLYWTLSNHTGGANAYRPAPG